MRDRREAQRRWDNLNRTIRRDGKFTVLVKVLEVQKRGAIHYHLLVKIGQDIRTGFDWEAFKRAGEAYQAKDKEEGAVASVDVLVKRTADDSWTIVNWELSQHSGRWLTDALTIN